MRVLIAEHDSAMYIYGIVEFGEIIDSITQNVNAIVEWARKLLRSGA